MNTTMHRHTCFEWAFSFCSISNFLKKIGIGTTDTDCANIPKEKLLAYIYDTIPGLKGVDIPEPKAWKCPDQVLPTPIFYQGDLVVWNDEYVPPTHGARMSMKDDGPFTVSVVDDFIVAFVRDENGSLVATGPRTDRITVETPRGRAIIAHPGYFKIFKRKE